MASHIPVDKLILIDAAGVKPRRSIRYYMRVYGFKAMKALCHIVMPKDKAEAAIERWRKRKASADYASASPRMRSILSRVVNEDLCHMMPQIKAPTLLVWGEDDTATPMADAKFTPAASISISLSTGICEAMTIPTLPPKECPASTG